MDTHTDEPYPAQTSPQVPAQPTSSLNGPSTAPPLDNAETAAAKKRRKAELLALSKMFGNIPNVPIFSHWETRVDCSNSAVHRPTMAGIFGNGVDGAYSVTLSGSYKDNEDGGDVIIYTGAGGRKRWSDATPPKRIRCGPHIYDQSWDKSENKALIMSFHTGNPVRVIRSWKCGSQYSPLWGYRYDGLYRVAAYWAAKGRNGKKICRCRLERLPDQPPIPLRPVTMSTSRKKQRQRPVSHLAPCPSPTDTCDIQGDLSVAPNQTNSPALQLTGSHREFPNPPQQRRVASSPSALPRYRWDPKRMVLTRVLVTSPITEDLGAADEVDEENRVEDDVTLVPSGVSHVVNERTMNREYSPEVGGSPQHGTPNGLPTSRSSVSESQQDY